MNKSILTLIIVSLSYLAQAGLGSDKPNFIFILTDDQPYNYMGFTGNEVVKTPNLDKLSSESVFFNNAHVTSAICTPSRVSILLSQYERTHGVNFNSGTSVNDEAWSMSYPVVMRDNGYYTGWIGKNHAPIGKGGYQSGVMEKSFDYWYAGHGHLSFYPKKRHDIFKNAEFDTQVEVIDEGVQDFLTNDQKLDGAVQFLGARPSDKPFMLSICFNLPHGNGTGSMKMKKTDDEIYKSLYRDQEIKLPNNYVAKADIKNPKIPSDVLRAEQRQTGYNYSDTEEDTKERMIRMYQAMTGIDRMVGNLLATLKKEGLDKNTVIVFTSDHGLFMGEFGLGGKALCYEVTTHVPMFIMDPRMPKKYRRQTDALVSTIDIAPTMLTLAGIPIPSSFQGKDLSSFLEGDNDSPREYTYTENLWSTQFGNPKIEAVQDNEWKYIRYYKNISYPATEKIRIAKEMKIPVNKMLYAVHDNEIPFYRTLAESSLQGQEPDYEELFNLKEDPEEVTNLVSKKEYETKLKEMRAVWKKELTAARGKGTPKVFRYTATSKLEAGNAGTGH
ncbi:sulfatase-like hydrolase/transferase [Reichenbachiella versicolor]|uniref:sulfatase-like hydrolase/transferase n=1 Tax=Reichenbachiella versicolor TaxID=1821036 RepID=UPI000D6E4B47|nr:sulfatase-like hydrolase/transferase [Reichenbachiella versicolor]